MRNYYSTNTWARGAGLWWGFVKGGGGYSFLEPVNETKVTRQDETRDVSRHSFETRPKILPENLSKKRGQLVTILVHCKNLKACQKICQIGYGKLQGFCLKTYHFIYFFLARPFFFRDRLAR